jgi:tight adherence protein B|uniref:Type II secretion system protein GspF domain-containing protein n=1 Tax=Desulfobacca acetoxidans TaxID=60893 RepID=A0A7C3UXK7_9BACT
MAEFSLRDLWYALGLSGIFVGLLLFFSALYATLFRPMRQRRQVVKRLTASSEELQRRVQIIKDRLEDRPYPLLLRVFIGPPRLNRLQRALLQSDIFIPAARFVTIWILLAAAGFLFGYLFLRSALLGLLIAACLAVLPHFYLKRKKTQKSLAVERQMPDAMELLARSLRAGHTLPSAVELLGEEIDHPLGTEMRIVYEQQRFGMSIPEALSHILDRVDSQDMRYFVTAVLIQHESGGNLVEVLEKIGHIIRARLNFKAKIRALTAEGRWSAIVLSILPVVLFLALMAIRREYEAALLTTSTGRILLFFGVVMTALGAFLMKRFIDAVEV